MKKALLVLGILLLISSQGLAGNYYVSNCNDSGSGSLRQALTDGGSGNFNKIYFNITTAEAGYSTGEAYPGLVTTEAGSNTWFRIIVNSALPAISGYYDEILGSTQTWEASNALGPEIEIRAAAGLNSNGIATGTGASQHNTIEGLAINNFSGVGKAAIYLTGTGYHHVWGCYLGTTATGEAACPNYNGIGIAGGSTTNQIGGTTTYESNVISGNNGSGIYLSTSTSSNKILGNYIGTTRTGETKLGNASYGIYITGSSSNNIIGGETAAPGTGAGNLISGNNTNGIYIDSGNSNRIIGNLIGTNKDGTSSIFNGTIATYGHAGIHIWTSYNQIGGTASTSRNIIAGNIGSGVCLEGSSANNNKILGNYIGTTITGEAALANKHGIVIYNCPSNNIVGSTEAGGKNIISGNVQEGIWFQGAGNSGDTTINNEIIGNYIGTGQGGDKAVPNGTYGIALYNYAHSNRIGNAAGNGKNVISGNQQNGIYLSGTGTNSNEVLGNYIGTDKDGALDLGNTQNGIFLNTGPQYNLIVNNVVSGNDQSGIYIFGTDTGSNEVSGNYIGIAADGQTPRGNTRWGILLESSDYSKIGRAQAGYGNVISCNGTSNPYSGIGVSTSNYNEILGNLIGTDANGNLDRGNKHSGIYMATSQANQIGNGTNNGRNLISGHSQNGIYIASSNNIEIKGNYIGTDLNGLNPISNEARGIYITNTADNNYIGGSNAGDGNLISGNGTGILITTSSNEVKGNKIGVNADATASLPNSTGLNLSSSTAYNNIIGGLNANEANIISGNTSDGLNLSAGHHNTIKGNYIGTNATGTVDLGNRQYGIYSSGCNSNVIGPANTIAYNSVDTDQAGITVINTSTSETITQNSFYSNHTKGIILDANANRAIATPEISSTSYSQLTGLLQITGTATPNATVEIFKAQGNQGKTYLGLITAGGTGVINGSLTYLGLVSGDVLAATQTDTIGDTSEFGLTREVTISTAFMYQPDNMIGTLESGADYIGENVFNTDGHNQAVLRNLPWDVESATFFVKIKAAGNTSDEVKVKGTASMEVVDVAYYDSKTAGNNITSQIIGSGWTTSLASGESKEIRLIIKGTPMVIPYFIALVTSESVNDISKKDAVMAAVQWEVAPPVPAPHSTQEVTFPSIPGMSIIIPAAACTQDVTVTASIVTAPGAPPAGYSVGGQTFNIGSTPVNTFSVPVTVTIPITGPLTFPKVYYWDGTKWSTDGIVVISHTATSLTFTTTHFTIFAPMATLPGNLVRFGPNPYNPNNGSGKFWYVLSADADTTIYLIDLAGTVQFKQTYPAGTNGGKNGENNIAYNGNTAWGDQLGQGVYIYKIVQGGKAIGGGKIAVIK